MSRPSTIWLVKAGEPLPIDIEPRLLRMGALAKRLALEGWNVVWWSPRFDHARKRQRVEREGTYDLSDTIRLVLLKSCEYEGNLSLRRIRSLRQAAGDFSRRSEAFESPDLILAAYPFTELCEAARQYSQARGIPFVLDIRDPWPDHLPGVMPSAVRWAASPVMWYYQSIFRRLLRDAAGVVAVSESMLTWALEYAERSASGRDALLEIGYDPLVPAKAISVPSVFSEATPLECVFFSSGGHSYDGETIIEAFRFMREKGERRVRCFFTGDGELHRRWRRELGEGTGIVFTGFVPSREMQELLRTAHVGIISMTGDLPRFWLGNKFFEYVSGSLALVNNAEGDAARTIGRYDLGVTVPKHAPEALARELMGLANSPPKVEHFMNQSRQVFMDRYDRDKLYGRYVNHLSQFLGARHGHADALHGAGAA